MLLQQLQIWKKERDYYRDQLKEAQAVIKQLVDGPGEVEYIHPYDFYEIVNALPATTFIDVNQDLIGSVEDALGKKYKQSTLIPAKSKNFQ